MVQAHGQADCGLYIRIPVELDRRLRAAAAARGDGYLRHGAFKPFLVEVLQRGIGALELAAQALDAEDAAERAKTKPRRKRLKMGPALKRPLAKRRRR